MPAAIVPIKLPPLHLSLPKNSSRIRSSSVGSNDSSMASPTVSSSGGSSITNNNEIQQPSSVGFTEKITKSSPQPPVIYRWDDESNGEIYTDRTLAATGGGAANNEDHDEDIEHNDLTENESSLSNPGSSSIGLYVVENGKEYPLLPIR